MFGIKEFTAVINPPQAAILAVGCAQASLDDDKIVSSMTVALSCDSRVISENTAAEFITLLKGLLENPVEMGL